MPLHGPDLSLSEFTSAWKRSAGSDVRPGMLKIVNVESPDDVATRQKDNRYDVELE